MSNYLDQVIKSQKRGEARGITSICSAHPTVLKTAIKRATTRGNYILVESTCNQVNQFGGYTGMKPTDFVAFLRGMAEENNLPFERIILGGDHLGPNVWQNENAQSAMDKSKQMMHDYVRAGYGKIHLDCSMKLADDDSFHPLDVEISAQRAAELAKVAEDAGGADLRYVIGTEVPVPGGATEVEEGIAVSKIADVEQTIEMTRKAFLRLGLESAWERVIAVVVQPGVEFGDAFIEGYQAQNARELSSFIQKYPHFVYEAHSTDYQTAQSLQELVRDHFAILKVGPALTFAYREAVFALAMMEDEFFAESECSNLIEILDGAMLENPLYWKKYYQGQDAFKRKFSLSDRVRYYWTVPKVQNALKKLFENWAHEPMPPSLLSQFAPQEYEKMRSGKIENLPMAIVGSKVGDVLGEYERACNGKI